MNCRNYCAGLALVLFIASAPGAVAAGSGELMQNGKVLYDKYCAICHGKEGKGDGDNSDSMDPPPRDLTDSGKDKYMQKRTVDELYSVIKLGGPGVDKSPTMPGWGKTFSEYDIWSLISYIGKLCVTKDWKIDMTKKMERSLPNVTVKALDIPQPVGSAARIGKRLYKKEGCNACHQIRSLGGESGPVLTGIASRLKPDQIYRVIQNARSVKDDSVMPVYGLEEESAVYLTQYLLTLK